MFDTVLVANRGEIAVRIMSTLRKLGIRTVAVYSDADVNACHVRMADLAVHIGPANARDSYLSIERIMGAVEVSGAQAVHPGYGFLSENADFARTCAAAGVVFIGPSASVIELMGDKINAKNTVAAAGVRVVPGRAEPGMSNADLVEAVMQIGFPALLKPSAGGGGKGMHVVETPADLTSAIESARREASGAFGDDTLFVERYISTPRHIEIQVLGDEHGNVIHLGERECSLQRRHQKIIEEAPSPLLDERTRTVMGQAAVDTAKAVGYTSTGTVEFIVSADAPDEFFFMEMNTRLQVEHGVTELVTGLDLVEQQIRIAAGQSLTISQNDVRLNGHAVEARVYAEDPRHGFLPTGGQILSVAEPVDLVRVDSALISGFEVGSEYDPMLAKYLAHGSTRAEALSTLRLALSHAVILGVVTNIPFLRALLADPEVRAGDLETGLIERKLTELTAVEPPAHLFAAAALAQILDRVAPQINNPWGATGSWRIGSASWASYKLVPAGYDAVVVRVRGTADDAQVVVGNGPQCSAKAQWDAGVLLVEYDGVLRRYAHARQGEVTWLSHDGASWTLSELGSTSGQGTAAGKGATGPVISPMPGVVSLVHVRQGEAIREGQPLFVVEAMKMEHTVTAGADGVIAELSVHAGQQVRLGQVLASIIPSQLQE